MNSSNSLKAKPFLKWVGGKGQLLKSLEEYYPDQLKQGQIDYYYEPFLGGGAVFFNLIQKYSIKKAYLFDVNGDLILTYRVIQKDPLPLIQILKTMEKEYLAHSQEKRKTYYYQVREKLNADLNTINLNSYHTKWINRAAQIIFLNKTCFNGLFRLNSKGEFNTPIGRYVNPTICHEANIQAVSSLLQKTSLQKMDYKQSLKKIKPHSFIYLDPPYRPLNKTASFTAYSKSSFNDQNQIELAQLCQSLHDKNTLFLLSNSDPQNTDPNDCFFEELYDPFHISKISATRMINSQPDKRGSINELLIKNY